MRCGIVVLIVKTFIYKLPLAALLNYDVRSLAKYVIRFRKRRSMH